MSGHIPGHELYAHIHQRERNQLPGNGYLHSDILWLWRRLLEYQVIFNILIFCWHTEEHAFVSVLVTYLIKPWIVFRLLGKNTIASKKGEYHNFPIGKTIFKQSVGALTVQKLDNLIILQESITGMLQMILQLVYQKTEH